MDGDGRPAGVLVVGAWRGVRGDESATKSASASDRNGVWPILLFQDISKTILYKLNLVECKLFIKIISYIGRV